MPKLYLLSVALLALAAPALAQTAAPTPPAGSRNNGGVMRYDANKDGVVDHGEWKAGQEARFKRLDINGDGKLTQDELFASTPAVGNSVLPTDRQASRQSSYFQRLDTDKDGFVSLSEFMAQGELNFARCDLDKNGKIDTAKCRQALQQRR